MAFDSVADFFDSQYLSEAKVAAGLGLSVNTVYKWKKENRLPQGGAKKLADLFEDALLQEDLAGLESDRGPGRPSDMDISSHLHQREDGTWVFTEG